MKSCTSPTCEQENPQPLDNFYKRLKGKASICKTCALALAKKNYVANREKKLAYAKEYYSNSENRLHSKFKAIERTYNLPKELFIAMLEAQDYNCAICGSDNGRRFLEVDHDHACCPGKYSCGECIRGLLCNKCNSALAFINDDLGILECIKSYLTDGAFLTGGYY